VLRTTPIVHSKDLKLGGVDAEALAASPREDQEIETRALADLAPPTTPDDFRDKDASGWGSRFPMARADADITGLKRVLLELCNNAPSGWDVGPAFTPAKGKSSGVVIKSSVEAGLAHEFGSKDAPRWQRANAESPGKETFDFWTSLRFGPLTYD
jgi:hypothetical protein